MGRALGGDVPKIPCTSVVTSPGRNTRARGIPYRRPHRVDGKPNINVESFKKARLEIY